MHLEVDLLGEGRLVSEGAVDKLVGREREDDCDPSVTGGTHLAKVDCVCQGEIIGYSSPTHPVCRSNKFRVELKC